MKKSIYTIIYLTIFLITACENNQKELAVKNDELVTLNIVFETLLPILFETPVPIDNKIQFTLHEILNIESNIYEGKIERRGGFSISFPKHSYEIDLKKDVSLVNLPYDDDWILNANYIDKTFLRHSFSYEIFSTMGSNNISSECRYVEVELNGEYNGLYVLMEKLDKSSLELNGSDTSAFIFKEPHIFRESYDGIIPKDTSNFHQQTFPKIERNDKREYLEGIRDFILNSNNIEFEEMFPNVFDASNIIDWHLLLLISNNSDGILKNYYLYKIDNETPIRVSPWDYDHSFGRDGDNELNLDERPLNIERSILFKRLLQFNWYKIALKQKWEELNKANILNKSCLKERILAKSNSIREAAKKNFEVWPLDSDWYYDANNFDDEINIMINFIDLKHERLTKYFDELQNMNTQQ